MALFLYTLVGSLPLLVIIRLLDRVFSMGRFMVLQGRAWNLEKLSVVSLIFTLAFLVKLPIFLFHSWLPKAHVEAPVYGSIFLAGTLLKLGGVGLLRFSGAQRSPMWAVLCAVALGRLVCVGVFCVISRDIKVLIAFSSVAHMGLALALVS